MDATEMFLARHQRIHAHVARLTEGLTETQIRDQVHPLTNPLAWILWHIARSEDLAVNRLVVDGAEVLDDSWCARLRAARRDVGAGMTTSEVHDLCAEIDLPSLAGYWTAVGERTVDVVRSVRSEDLDEVVSPERVRRVAQQSAAEPARAALEVLWQGTARGHFLVWLPLAHICEHVGQADLIRGMLGLPGRF